MLDNRQNKVKFSVQKEIAAVVKALRQGLKVQYILEDRAYRIICEILAWVSLIFWVLICLVGGVAFAMVFVCLLSCLVW